MEPTKSPTLSDFEPESETVESAEFSVPSLLKQTVGDYELGRVLGEGSYSTVVEARHSSTGRLVAVKVLDKRQIVKLKKIKYVHVEKEVLTALAACPLIVKLLQTLQDPQSLYFVLEKCDMDLLELIRTHDGLQLELVKFYSLEMMHALKFMHDAGIIHRDFKPENVLISPNGRHIRLTDFGTAKILAEESKATLGAEIPIEEDPQMDKARGSSSSFVGTAEYISPELLSERDASFESDIWAFGCVLYQMIVNRPPFKAANDYLIFQKITKLEYSCPSFMPEQVVALIRDILMLNPEERPLIPEIIANACFDSLRATFGTDNLLNVDTTKYDVPEAAPFVPAGGWTDDIIQEKRQLQQTQVSKTHQQLYALGQSKVTYDMKWKCFLEDGEDIIFASMTVKKRKYFLGKDYMRYLILTNRKRLVYVDPDAILYKGDIPLSRNVEVGKIDDVKFYIQLPTRRYEFSLCENETAVSVGDWVSQVTAIINEN